MRLTLLLFSWFMISVAFLSLAGAEETWELLIQSPGALENLALNGSGDLCIQEALRFTRLPADRSTPLTQESPESERIFISPQGGVIATIIYEGKEDKASAAQIVLKRANGLTLWSLAQHPLNDVYPLETGGAVAVARNLNLPENPVYFFSPQGKLVKQINLPAPGEIRSSPTGDRVIINSGIEGALLFDNQGNRLSDLGSAYRLNFSPDSRWIAILYGPKLTIFYEGKLAYSAALCGEIVRGATFSPEAAYLAVITDHFLFLLKNPGGEIALQRSLEPEGQLSYTSVDLTRNAAVLAVGFERDLGAGIKGTQRHPEGLVRLYNQKGDQLYQTEMTYSRWNTTTPRVQFSLDGRQLLVLTRDEIRRASLQALLGKEGE